MTNKRVVRSSQSSRQVAIKGVVRSSQRLRQVAVKGEVRSRQGLRQTANKTAVRSIWVSNSQATSRLLLEFFVTWGNC